MKKQSAFTLIELMIVITIIAILAAVGYPVYTNQIKKGRRSDAQQLLLETASKEEQYILAARAYSNDFSVLSVTKDGWTCSGTSCSNNFYDVAITVDNSAAPPVYSIDATAKGAQADDGDLSLDSTGARTHGTDTKW